MREKPKIFCVVVRAIIIQLAKILLLPPKYEIIIVPSYHSNRNIGLFSIAPCKVIVLILFASFFASVLSFFFDGFLSKVIALPTTAIAIVVAIVGRAITIWEAIQKRSHETIYKTHTRIEAKRLRAKTFAIT